MEHRQIIGSRSVFTGGSVRAEDREFRDLADAFFAGPEDVPLTRRDPITTAILALLLLSIFAGATGLWFDADVSAETRAAAPPPSYTIDR